MILVDSCTLYDTELPHKEWCHMVSDVSGEELEAFARQLGLKPSWSQRRPKASSHHYDLVPSKRALALRYGAVEVTSRELAARNYDGLARRRASDGAARHYRELIGQLVRLRAAAGGALDAAAEAKFDAQLALLWAKMVPSDQAAIAAEVARL